MRTKNIIRVAIVAGMLLLVPLIAMQFTDEVVWTLSDFIAAGIMLLGAGLAYEWLASRSASITYKLGAGLAVATGLFLVWANLAVGFIGSGPNPANLMYGGMLAIGITGSIMARFRPAGMARTMYAMALAQVVVPLVALTLWDHGISWVEHATETKALLAITAFFAVLWLASALLFRRADLASSSQGKGLAAAA